MAPTKKKNKGKKSKRKAPEDVMPPEEPSEYDGMDLAVLREVVSMLAVRLEQAAIDRNYVQIERDTIESYYDLTRQQSNDIQQEIIAKEREMELMQQHHCVEVRVYQQKVKQLEYEHNNNRKRIQTERDEREREEIDVQSHRDTVLRSTQHALRLELRERELVNEDEVKQLQQMFDKNLLKIREQFQQTNAQLEQRLEHQLDEQRAHLDLRRRVEIHEMEERKNLHINDLMRNHERAFRQIRDYYNDVTRDNLRLIDGLKQELVNMRQKAVVDAKLMHDVSRENKLLLEPLTATLQEVQSLRNDLRDVDKDTRSLAHAKARVRTLHRQTEELRTNGAELELQSRRLAANHHQLIDNFEHSVDMMAKKCECRNLILEQRIAQMATQHASKSYYLDEISSVAGIDPDERQRIVEQMARELDERNAQLERLRKDVSFASNTYNDSLRTLTHRMVEMGIPEEVVHNLNFRTHASNRHTAPAGLVVAN